MKDKITTLDECTRLLNGSVSKQDASLNPGPDKYNWTKFHLNFTKLKPIVCLFKLLKCLANANLTFPAKTKNIQ